MYINLIRAIPVPPVQREQAPLWMRVEMTRNGKFFIFQICSSIDLLDLLVPKVTMTMLTSQIHLPNISASVLIEVIPTRNETVPQRKVALTINSSAKIIRLIGLMDSLFKINQLIAFVNSQLSSLDVYCFTNIVSILNIYTLQIDFDFSYVPHRIFDNYDADQRLKHNAAE